MFIVTKIGHWSQSKKKYLINLIKDKRLEEITNLDKKVDLDDLIYRCKCFTTDAKFNEFGNAFNLLNKIMIGKISLVHAKSDQAEIKSNLSEVKKGNKKHRPKVQKNTLHNIEMLCKTRNSVIEFFDDYSLTVSKAKRKATKEAELRILTPKQMLQR